MISVKILSSATPKILFLKVFASSLEGVLEISCQSDKIQILRVENARRKTNRF